MVVGGVLAERRAVNPNHLANQSPHPFAQSFIRAEHVDALGRLDFVILVSNVEAGFGDKLSMKTCSLRL
jgi:hypothetical protein